MSDNECLVVYMTAKDKAEARLIVNALLSDQLIACANIIDNVESHYVWEGQAESAQEVIVIMKARADQFSNIEQSVLKHHSYDVPCLTAWPISKGHLPYLDWVSGQKA